MAFLCIKTCYGVSKKGQATTHPLNTIDPTQSNPFKNLDQDTIHGLKKAVIDAMNIIRTHKISTMMGAGWGYIKNLGNYGSDIDTRATVAYGGIGANVNEEAFAARTFVDSTGNKLNGRNNYLMHFEKGQIPNVQAFWSLTLYDSSLFLVKNPINRYIIGDRTEGLQYNTDGSLDIYIQHSPPLGKESNWLPASDSDFNLVMRMYQPGLGILHGSYQLPPVNKVN
ncbi:DUF1214 domain-containing protein [Neobacillus drentensis]|uniref:DUF1214 domain-containing protein n=1 Tax=Neobacillus drentensis TaxID=220684 RepID=UPI003000E00B